MPLRAKAYASSGPGAVEVCVEREVRMNVSVAKERVAKRIERSASALAGHGWARGVISAAQSKRHQNR
jgi:hypothetical protein